VGNDMQHVPRRWTPLIKGQAHFLLHFVSSLYSEKNESGFFFYRIDKDHGLHVGTMCKHLT
jgi:hypothetical protein